MCLAIPSKVIQIENGFAIVDTMGTKRKISLQLLNDDIEIGDYVLVHVGFAIEKLSEEEALETLKLFEDIAMSLEEEYDKD